MRNDLLRALPRFRSAVLTFRDAHGYPFSVRCHPLPDPGSESFTVHVPEGVPARAGPASVLWHAHDEQLWNQVSYTTRGVLERVGTGWRYRPAHYTPGLGIRGVPGLVQFVVGARRTTAAYLARRRLERPKVPWGQINAIKSRTLGHR
jgi:hypothetical protein